MRKIILAGYGGQGMLLCGQILAYAAMQDGYHVTWLPTYGPEMRGGAAACSVVISENQIGSPVIQSADAVVVMSQPAFDKYHKSVSTGGCLIYSSSLITIPAESKRLDITYLGIDFSQLATNLGNLKVANMIVLGCLNEAIPSVKTSALHAALRYKFGEKKADVLAINEKAIEAGVLAVKEIRA